MGLKNAKTKRPRRKPPPPIESAHTLPAPGPSCLLSDGLPVCDTVPPSCLLEKAWAGTEKREGNKRKNRQRRDETNTRCLQSSAEHKDSGSEVGNLQLPF